MAKQKKFEGATLNHEPIKRKLPLLPDEKYIHERVQDQIDWHKRKSEFFLKKFNRLKNIDTVVASLVPVTLSIHSALGGIGEGGYGHTWEVLLKMMTAAAGVWLTISSGFFEVEGYERKAKDYKKLYKKLETEKFKYLTRTEPYDEDDAYGKIVLNIENQLHLDVMNYFKAEVDQHEDGEEEEEKNTKKKKSDK